MPPKKTKEPVESEHEEKVQLVTTINNVNCVKTTYNVDLVTLLTNMNKFKTEFTEAVQKVEQYNIDKFNNLENEYDKREREVSNKLDELKKSYDDLKSKLDREYREKNYDTEKKHTEKLYELDKEFKQKKYEYEQNFRKINDEMERKRDVESYNFCIEFLKSKNESVIKTTELNDKNVKLENLAKERQEEVALLKKQLIEQYNKTLKDELEKKDLTQKSESATVKAENEQKAKQITVLESMIVSLKNEINEQRALTKSVAEASRQASVVQNMGKQ